jgi:signal-transduction protein with cAMP-binding, CBS, and nucleotidyltransferase domain
MKAIDVIHRSVVGIGPERTIRDAAQVMERSGIGTLAVIDDHKLVGVVTDRDLVRRALARGLAHDSRVDGVMTSPVITIDADADVSEAFAMFRTHGLRRLIVVRQGKVQGVIAIDDLLVLVAAQLGDVCRPITAELLFAHRDSQLPATLPTAIG